MLFILKKSMAGLTLGKDKHDPHSYCIKDQVIREYWRDVSVPDLTVIKVKLKSVS